MDSTCKLPQVIEVAKQQGWQSLSLCNHNNLCEILDFQKACKKAELKPVFGVDLLVVAPDGKPYSLKFFAKNEEGLFNLMHLSTLANKGDKDIPQVTLDEIASYSSDLIVLTGGDEGYLFTLTSLEDFSAYYNELAKHFEKRDLYVEIQNHGIPQEQEFLQRLKEFRKTVEFKTVLTNSPHYILAPHSLQRSFLADIDPNHSAKAFTDKFTAYNDQFYLKTDLEQVPDYQNIVESFPDCIAHQAEILNDCNAEIESHIRIPSFPLTLADNSLQELKLKAWVGFNNLLVNTGKLKKDTEKYNVYLNRLKGEVEVIDQMHYVDYFLIVADFIQWCKDDKNYEHKENYFPKKYYDWGKIPDHILNKNFKIYVGPGRGSAAGSLLSLCLGITEVIDPLEYDLLFERFLNKDRVSMPDIDTDFENAHRDMVVEYCQAKYGFNCVAQIITFQTLKPRSLIRRIGKALDMSFAETDELSKNVNDFEIVTKDGEVTEVPIKTLEDVRTYTPYFIAAYQNNESVKQLFDMASVLDGLICSTGTHAAGVIISSVNLAEIIPLMEIDGKIVSQFEKNNSEEMGLLKMDFLGLKTQDLIKGCLELIHNSTGEWIDVCKFPLNDKKTFKLLQNAQTGNIFQFEGRGMRNLLTRLQPTEFSELAAVTSLFRPGPMQYIDHYIENAKNPEQIDYYHPLFKEVTEDTYGILIYQEQIMLLVQKLAGFSLAEADIMRRAMGKKHVEYMVEYRTKFTEGCAKNNISKELADKFFDMMLEFAKYGFNKSHACSYAYISYQCAYLKAHYPLEFMTACLNNNADDPDKLKTTLEECQTYLPEAKLLPPVYGKSHNAFSIEDGNIRYGYTGIKGIGGDVGVFLEKNNSYGDIKTLISAAGAIIKKNQLTALIHAGAFDCFGPRKALLDYVSSTAFAIKFTAALTDGSNRPYTLFDLVPYHIGSVDLPLKTRISDELDLLQIAFTVHPLQKVYESLKADPEQPIKNLSLMGDIAPRASAQCLFLVHDFHVITTKKGDKKTIFEVSDSSGKYTLMLSEMLTSDQKRALGDTMNNEIMTANCQKGSQADSDLLFIRDIPKRFYRASAHFFASKEIMQELAQAGVLEKGTIPVTLIEPESQSIEASTFEMRPTPKLGDYLKTNHKALYTINANIFMHAS